MNKQKTDTITYITTPEGLSAIVVASSNTAGREWYWVFTDHLGSITTLVRNSDGQKFEMSFDACKVKLGFCECSETKTLVEPISYEARVREGNRRDPLTWKAFTTVAPEPLFDRGFTGHVKQPFGLHISANQLRMPIPQRNDCGEHLDEFILINMNGRMYDPETARFLSPDVVIAGPSNPASYNPYAYVFNNPLKYTDPSGYVVDPVSIAAYIIAGAILYSSYAKQNADPATGKWDWDFTNWFSKDKPGCMLGITINTSFTNTMFFASMNWSNGSNTTLGYNTQYGWSGGSAPQNMYFPDESTAVSEATAVSNISSALSNYNQISAIASNYMDQLSAKVISGYPGVNLPGIEVVWNRKYGSGRIVRNMPGGYYVTGGDNLLSAAYNSALGRMIVPDFLAIGVGFSGIVGVGGATSVELRWVTHGPEASWKPMITVTQSAGGGYSVNATINFEAANYVGSVDNIRRRMMQTSTPNGDIPTIWGSGGVAAGGKIGVTGYITPNVGGSFIIGREINLGLGLPAGPVPVNGAGGVSNTWILYDFN